MKRRYRILVLYWNHESLDRMRVGVRQHLGALEASERDHELFYYNTFQQGPPAALKDLRFDAVVFHNLCLCMRWTPFFYHWKRGLEWVADLKCAKIAMPQDEYDHAEILDEWLYDLGVETIVSNFRNPAELKLLYPVMHDRARFEVGLTGYLDDRLVQHYGDRVLPIKDRPLDVVYRAKHLQYWFGSHGQIKWQVGEQVDRRARAKGMRSNISSEPEDVILGNKWLDFLASSRAITGCEGGSSVIDRRGEFQSQIEDMLRRQPGMSFDEVSKFMPAGWDDTIMPLTGPRHLEAAMTRTCQILVEGQFCGVLEAERHFIPIRRDYSNLDEVLDRLRDHDAIQKMVDRAFEEICLSGRYSSRVLAETLERAIDESAWRPDPISRFAIQPLWDACLADPKADEKVSLEISDEELAALGEPYMPEPKGQLAVSAEAQRPPPVAPKVDCVKAVAAVQSAGSLEFADAVVILTRSSDAEPAWTFIIEHFSRILPVFVVTLADAPRVVRGDTHTVIEVRSAGELHAALSEARAFRPVLLTNRLEFAAFLDQRYSAFAMWYLTEGLAAQLSTVAIDEARQVLERADLVLCGFEGAEARVRGELHAGVALEPFRPCADLTAMVHTEYAELHQGEAIEVVVAVRGVVDPGLDCALLERLAAEKSNWSIWIAGPLRGEPAGWERLLQHANVRYLAVDDEQWKWYAWRATVALQPYRGRPDALMTDALSMLAAGLPLVTTFAPWPEIASVTAVATDCASMLAQLEEAVAARFDAAAIGERRAAASAFDWRVLLGALGARIGEVRERVRREVRCSPPRLRVALLCAADDPADAQRGVEVLSLLSRHRVRALTPGPLDGFDAVVLHPRAVEAVEGWRADLAAFGGLKLAVLKTRADDAARAWLDELGFHAVCAPPEVLADFGDAPALDTLPLLMPTTSQPSPAPSAPPLRERPVTLAWHADFAPQSLGGAGNLHFILNRVESACERLGLKTDLRSKRSTDDLQTILGSSKALLIAHTHADLFDSRGNLRPSIRNAVERNQRLTYDRAANAVLADAVSYAQTHVMPRILEALALGAAIVTMEGSVFTHLLVPGRHCLELRRNFSNLDEILDRLQDDGFLTELVERAYREVGRSATLAGLVDMLDDYAAVEIRRPMRDTVAGRARVTEFST